MELAVWAVAALIAFGLIVLAVGLALPIDHVAIRTVTFPAEPQALWDAIHDPALARAAPGEVETEEIESVPRPSCSSRRSWAKKHSAGPGRSRSEPPSVAARSRSRS